MIFRYFTVLIIIIIASFNIAEASILSKKDKSIASKALSEAYKKNYSLAINKASKSSQPLTKKIVKWLKYRDANSQASFDEINQFLQNNPNWPNSSQIKQNAEKALSRSNASDRQIIQYFSRNPAITAGGQLLYLQSKENLGITPEEIQQLVKEIWIKGDFNRSQERDFMAKYGSWINEEDNIKRVDRMLWQNKITLAKRNLSKVPANYRKLFTARIKLLQNNSGVNRAINNIPRKLLQDPGFLYARVSWHKRRKNYSKMTQYLSQIEGDKPYPEKWWPTKKLLIRQLIEQQKYQQAYKLANDSHLTTENDSLYAESKWLAGWIALSFLDNPRDAYKHFYQMYQNVKYPISKARASYWAGRSAEANSNYQIAHNWYKLSAKNPTTFYGQLAFQKTNEDGFPALPDFPGISKEDNQEYKTNDLIKVAKIFIDLNLNRMAEKFIKASIKNSSSSGLMALISELGIKIKRNDMSVIAAKQAHKQGVLLVKTSYPTISNLVKNKADVELPLVYGIIRQESRFFHKARSPANALGLMQVLPSTARNTARLNRLRYSKYKLHNDPSYNILIGSSYLHRLLTQFDGSYILSIASYNAGPANARRWIRKFGDPRDMNLENAINWMESIPFAETRNYVQRVMENVQIYRHLLENTNLSLAQDITGKAQIAGLSQN